MQFQNDSVMTFPSPKKTTTTKKKKQRILCLTYEGNLAPFSKEGSTFFCFVKELIPRKGQNQNKAIFFGSLIIKQNFGENYSKTICKSAAEL